MTEIKKLSVLDVMSYLVAYLQEIAGLSAEPCEGEVIVVTVFDIKKTEVLTFLFIFLHNFQLFDW